jgi:NAD(P)-dependent dehydrogenase (short-subunit alcohol dehydrogenase family)
MYSAPSPYDDEPTKPIDVQTLRLDLAFNNGAVAVPPHPVADFPEDDFDLVTRINLKGLFTLCRPR